MTAELGKILILTGVFIALVGLVLVFLPRLPGDTLVQKDGVTFYFPVVTMIVVSVVVTLLLNVIPRLFR